MFGIQFDRFDGQGNNGQTGVWGWLAGGAAGLLLVGGLAVGGCAVEEAPADDDDSLGDDDDSLGDDDDSLGDDDDAAGDDDDAVGDDDDVAGDEVYAALVRGTLFTEDLAEAQTLADTLGAGGQDIAESLGDFAHDVLLGTDMLGTQENEFLALDRWTDLEGMGTMYGDPDFQAGFASLFAESATLETFVTRPDWASWGTLESGDAHDPYYFVIVRGRLFTPDLDEAQAMHDALAEGAQEVAEAAGDVAHVVHLGLDDPQEFLAIDVWTSADMMEMVYLDPDFQAGFAAVFEEPPTVGVYRSTDWYQW